MHLLLRYALSLCCLLCTIANCAAQLGNNLVAHYPLDGNANDISGNGNHATIINATPSTNRFNQTNRSYQFDGQTQYIEIPDNDLISIPTTGELSISVWMRPDVLDFNTNSYIHWMGKGVVGQHEYVLRMYNLNSTRPNRTSCYSFNLTGGLGAGSYVQETVTPGEWIHIVAVYNFPTNTIQLYKNGVLKDTDTFSGYSITPGNGTAPLRIGTRDFANYFEGAIDDLQIYNRVLTPSEISGLYNEAPPTQNSEVGCNFTVFLEGPYDATARNMKTDLRQAGQLPALQPYHHADWDYQGQEQVAAPPAGMVDWVLVSIRETATSGCITRKAAILLEDGTIAPFDLTIPPGLTSVYVLVEHRNHLPALSDQAVPIVNGTLTYDFTQTAGYTGGGSGQKMLGNDWGLIAGNGSQDGVSNYDLNAADNSYWAPINGTFNIYHPADYNMDNDVSAGDRALWGMNNGIFSGVTKLVCVDIPSTAPLLTCPAANFVLNDCSYTFSWTHANPISNTVNYDLRINGVDPGLSVVYPINSNTIDLCTALGISTGAGALDVELLYWYDGDVTNILSAGNCLINYDFDVSTSTEAELTCPPSNFVLEDCNYTISWTHDNPISSTVNYDLRINGIDPGLSVVYPVNSNTIDICSLLGITSGTGVLDVKLLYWYDGDLNNIDTTGICSINYDFDPVVVSNGNLVTCDNSRLAQASPYETLFHANLPKLMTTLRNFGTNLNDTQWQNNGGYCGVAGVKMYHYKAAVESITRMMLYANAVGLTSHVQDYQVSLWEILDDLVPKFISGNGTAGSSSTSEYYCGAQRNPAVTRHRYLDSSRLMAFSSYAICALIECGAVTAAQQTTINSWAVAVKPALNQYMNNMDAHCLSTNGGFSHMCLHTLTSAYLWSAIGGYNDFDGNISSNLATVLNTYQSTSGDLGSDIGHDTDAMSNISMVRDKQLLTGLPTGPLVTEAMLQLIGNQTAARINSGEAWPGATGLNPGYEHLHALTAGFSPAMANLVAPATNANYPNLAGGSTSAHSVLNHFVSVASAGWGFAMIGDGENCP